MNRNKLVPTFVLIFMSIYSFGQITKDSIQIHKSYGMIYSQNGKRIRMNQLLKLTNEMPEVTGLLKKSQNNKAVGTILGGVGGFMVGYQLISILGRRSKNWGVLAVGVGLSAISIPLSSRSNKQGRQAIALYNNSLSKTSSRSPEWKLRLNAQGIGLALKF